MISQKEIIKSLRANSNRTAIETGQQKISYAALLAMTDKITAYLLKQHIKTATIVGILLPGKTEMICSIIGIMNARCVFVPLDTTMPGKRLAALMLDLNPEYIISSREVQQTGAIESNKNIQVIFIEDILSVEENTESTAINYPEYDEDDSLYIYFTSGSTGIPKGIVGRNCSLLQFIKWEIKAFELNENCRVSQLVSPYFDAFLRDVFVPLLTGGTICIPPESKEFLSPEKITQWIDENNISLVHCVPGVFRVINNESITAGNFKYLKYVMLSGEKIIPSTLANWYKTFGERIQLVNFYGATETTMIRSYYKIRPGDEALARIPIGIPIHDTEIIIAGDSLRPCGALIPGDLYILSKYTSKGYLNAPALTQEKFIWLNAGTPLETIAYKTGDKARMLANGQIDLIGREDRQVKLRGIRIEPDEIENVMVQSGYVKNAIVVMQSEKNGDESLVAFIITGKPGKEGINITGYLQQYLESRLPEYMIPARITEVNEFPLLANGKINYKELLNQPVIKKMVAPVNETETRLVVIWKDILGDKPVSTEENFHSMGGNSISIMRLIGKIYKEFNVRISLDELFKNMTIKTQAALIAHRDADNLMIIPKAPLKKGYNLSAAQERLYYNYEINKEGIAFNLPMAWEINEEIDKHSIENVWRLLIERHESLRTEFTFLDGKLVQVIRDAIEFTVEESSIEEKDIQKTIREFVQPFNISKAPLMRCRLLHAGANKKILLFDIHHIICDGMSQSILLADFINLYRGKNLKPLPVQYKDYAEWEYNFKTTDIYTQQREFWLKSFEGEIPKLEWPTFDLHNEKITEAGGNITFTINRYAIKTIADVWKEDNITPFSGWFAVFYLFLAELTGQEDIVIGINATGRMQHELEGVTGMFVKTLPVRYRMDANKPFRQFSTDLHNYLVQANSKQVYDLADILTDINNNRAVQVKNLFDAMFVFLDFENKKPQASVEGFANYNFENTTAKYPVTLFAGADDDTWYFRWEYSTTMFTKADSEMLVAQFKTLVERIAANVQATNSQYIGVNTASSPLVEENISFNF